jgi:hypothetical protein
MASWDHTKNNDTGEASGDVQSIFERKRQTPNSRQGMISYIKEGIIESLLEDTLKNSAEYEAVVYKVLSGPTVRNEASTNGGNLRKSINLSTFKTVIEERKKSAKNPVPVVAIARVEAADNMLIFFFLL